MNIAFQAFHWGQFDVSGLGQETRDTLDQAAVSKRRVFVASDKPGLPNDHALIDTPNELYRALHVLDAAPQSAAASQVRHAIFDHLFATKIEQVRGEKSKFCHDQIGGCEQGEKAIRSVHHDQRTIYEWTLGVSPWGVDDNTVLTRQDLRTGERSYFAIDQSTYRYIHSIGSAGQDLYALMRSQHDHGLIAGRITVNGQQATFNAIEHGHIKSMWRVGSYVYCYPQDFSVSRPERPQVGCALHWAAGHGRSNFSEVKLTSAAFENVGSLLSHLGHQRDNFASYGNDSMRAFVRRLGHAYVEGNPEADPELGLDNLRRKFRGHFSEPTLLFFNSFLQGLVVDRWEACSETKSAQVLQIVHRADTELVKRHLLAQIERVVPKFPNLARVRDWIAMRSTSGSLGQAIDPMPESESVGVLDTLRPLTLESLLREHVTSFTKVGTYNRSYISATGQLPVGQRTQNFHCGDPHLVSYRDAVNARAGGAPYSHTQLNVFAAYFQSFISKNGYYSESSETADRIKPGKLRNVVLQHVHEHPHAVIPALRAIAEKMRAEYAAELDASHDNAALNFGNNIHRIEELNNLIAFLERVDS